MNENENGSEVSLKFSNILRDKYNKCNFETKDLFHKLIDGSSEFCTDHAPVEMKEFHYRLQKKSLRGKGKRYQNFCIFTLTPSKNGITVHLRTDGIQVASDIISLSVMNHCTYLRGKEWIRFGVYNLLQTNEAIRLIREVYNYEANEYFK